MILSSSPHIEFFNEDCMSSMSRMKDNAFDLAIVDPPYGIGEFWNKQKHTSHFGKNDWNEQAPNAEYFQQLMRVSKNQIIFGANYYTEHLPVTNSWIFWDKGNDVIKMNTSEGELAWTSFNIPMRKVYVQWSGARKGSETGIKTIHPCQRPLDLHRWLLHNYAKEGNKILDTHGGSLSIAIACHQLGYDLTAYELDKDYYEAAIKRFKENTIQLDIFKS